MAVMGVAHMGVSMGCVRVLMAVGMPERLIVGHPPEVVFCMGMVVMGISVAGVVAMAVGVLQRLVPMPVAVPLVQQQGYPACHQACRHCELGGECLSQHH
jgi:hypothetical protein